MELANSKVPPNPTAHDVLRVLMVDSEVPWRGGEGQLELLMRGLRGGPYRVGLAAPDEAAITERARALGVRCLSLPIAGGLDLRAAWKLRQYLRSGEWDLVHTHSAHAHSVAFLAMRALPGSVGARGERVRLVVSRRVDFPIGVNPLSAFKYDRGGDVYLAISRAVRDVLLEGGVGAARVVRVQSGIDLDKFANVPSPEYLYEEFGLEKDAPIVGNIAALAPHKSQADFIAAAEQVLTAVPTARFFIVGEGPLERPLRELIRSKGLEGEVVMTGFRRDALAFLRMFRCFVLSSYLEGLCTSIMDAQAAGTAVVATNTGGVPDLVEDGVTGLLVPPRAPHRLAEAIVRMLRDSALRYSCVESALQRARSYDYVNMVKGTVAAYRQVMKDRGVDS